MQSFHSPRHCRPAFTLIEVLLVILIIGGLLSITAPAIQGAVTASRLRDNASSVSSAMFEAQQLAFTLGAETEVRFYQLPDIVGADPTPLLRKVQVFTLSPPPDGPAAQGGEMFVPEGPATTLNSSVVISPDAALSSIVQLGFKTHKDDKQGAYVAFRFHADGSTDLAQNKEWFLTVLERKPGKSTTKPKNFVTLQIDPASGRVRSFQP